MLYLNSVCYRAKLYNDLKEKKFYVQLKKDNIILQFTRRNIMSVVSTSTFEKIMLDKNGY